MSNIVEMFASFSQPNRSSMMQLVIKFIYYTIEFHVL